jgi:hypothetical protein
VPQVEFVQLLQLAEDLFKSLVEVVEDFVEPQLPTESWSRLFASPVCPGGFGMAHVGLM